MAGPDGKKGDDESARALQERLARVTDAIEQRKAEYAAQHRREDAVTGGAMGLGFRVLGEFVAAVVVGGVVGWQADEWLGSSPALLIVMVGLGTAAGFWNVYRIAVGGTGTPGKRK